MVGADADLLIQEYDTAHGGTRQASVAETPGPAAPLRLPRRRANCSAALGLVIAAVVICWVVHACERPSHDGNGAARHKPVSVPAPAPPARRSARGAVPRQPRRPLLVQLAAAEGCWVGVYAADGTVKWQAYVPAGAARSWVFTHRVSMRIGNRRGVVLTVNGHRINSLGGQAMTLNL
jgi:cytoskeleton protein RodZ